MKTNWFKRTLCSILAFVMVLGYVPATAFASEADGLCEHHTQHTQECRYSPAVEAHDCGHEHTDDCYDTVTECVHTHDDCGYVEAVAGVPCGHICSLESGCIQRVMNCQHQHDSECGYAEEKTESSCTYACEECEKERALQQNTRSEEQALDISSILTWEDYLYTLLADGSVSICGFEGAPENEEEAFLVEIPSEINGAKVTEIAENAFAGNEEIEIALLPKTIDSIGNGAFEDCKKLKVVAFCGEELSFGKTFAKYSEKLETILVLKDIDFTELAKILEQDLGEAKAGSIQFRSFTNIAALEEAVQAEGANSGNGDVDRQLGNGISALNTAGNINVLTTTYGKATPEARENENIVAGGTCGENVQWKLDKDGLLTISGTGEMRDYDAHNAPWHDLQSEIKSVIVEKNVSNIGVAAFWDCGSITSVTISEGVNSIGEDAFRACSNLTSVTIPEGVTSIGNCAFGDCINLISVSIPESVTTIGNSVFYRCNNLTSVTIPEGITAIASETFYGCSSLTSLTIPKSVTSIGAYAFEGCSGLTSMTIPEGVTTIGMGAFRYCSSLTAVSIPKGVATLDNYTFDGCSSLVSATIPEGVATIGGAAFSDCSNLTSATIPSSVTSIGFAAFSGCTKLTDIHYSGTAENWGQIAIGDGNTALINAEVHYNETGDNTVASGKCGENVSWTLDSSGILTIFGSGSMHDWGQDFLAPLPPSPWYSKRQEIKAVAIESGVTYIGMDAFYECSSLSSVTISESVTSIGKYAFYGCNSLTDVYYSGTEEDWAGITIGSYNASLTKATIHYNSAGFELEYVRYFSKWDEVNKIAYFGPGDMLGNQVTTETDPIFAENPTAFLGQYVLVKTKPRTDGLLFPEILVSVKKVETKTGTVTAADAASVTIDSKTYATPMSMTQPESYVDQFVLYHLYNGSLVEVEILETIEGTLISWDEQTRVLNVNLDGAAKNPVDYTLSPLVDKETVSRLNSGSLLNSKISYICDCSGLVYHVESAKSKSGKCGDNLTWGLDDDGTLTITGTGDMYDYKTQLEDELPHAPWDKGKVKKVVLMYGVTSIGAYAFNSCNINSIQIPVSVTNVKSTAFDGCKLGNIYYDGSVEQWKDLKNTFSDQLKDSKLNNAAIIFSGHIVDTWRFSNTSLDYGDDSEGYFITSKDYNQLIKSLSNADKEEVEYDWVLSPLHGKKNYNIDGKSTGYIPWAGSCYGMSSWVCLNSYGIRNAFDIDETSNQLHEFVLPPKSSPDVESAINFYHFQQCISKVRSTKRAFLQLSQSEQLSILKELGQISNEKGKVFRISFDWYPVTGQNKLDKKNSQSHAVVGYGWEEIAPTTIIVNGTTYSYNNRILIYDCAAPSQRKDFNLYFNNDGIWCIPGYDIVSTQSNSNNSTGNNGQLSLATNNPIVINAVDYNTGEFSSGAQTSFQNAGNTESATLSTDSAANYTLLWENSTANISGFSVEGENKNSIVISLDAMITAEGEYNGTSSTAFLPDGINNYTVKSNETMNFIFRNNNYYTGAAISSPGTMTFSQDGMVSVDADNTAAFYLDIVANDGCHSLPWYKVEISGTGAKNLSTEKIEDGIIISGDNLKDVAICVTSELEEKEIVISSDETSVLLTQKENEPAVYEDTDGDGTFEKEITDSEEIKVNVAGMGLHVSDEVWIDGVKYSVQSDGNGLYVTLPDANAHTMVTYSYNNPNATDVHTKYPTGMNVWTLAQENGVYFATYVSELDNLLQYSGSSIRITGNKGIRMITSVNQDTRNKLTGNGLAGFKLLEYGTLLAQTSKLKDNPLVLGGGDYVKSNYAYKKGVADPVFKYANGLIQYTNVLIGFTDEQCKEDIAMRPYMKLLDENGEEFVIYGGIVYRSIGYIAYQNRNAFQPGSAAYEYVWSIIRNVYGTKYDSEYRK